MFDDQGYNVAFGKPITGTPAYSSSFLVTSVNDGVVQMDTDPGNMYHTDATSATAGDKYFIIDLGGVYRVQVRACAPARRDDCCLLLGASLQPAGFVISCPPALQALVVFNRIGGVTTNPSIPTTNLLGRMSSATIQLMNNFSSTIVTITVPSTAAAIMTFNVTLPSPTRE